MIVAAGTLSATTSDQEVSNVEFDMAWIDNASAEDIYVTANKTSASGARATVKAGTSRYVIFMGSSNLHYSGSGSADFDYELFKTT